MPEVIDIDKSLIQSAKITLKIDDLRHAIRAAETKELKAKMREGSSGHLIELTRRLLELRKIYTDYYDMLSVVGEACRKNEISESEMIDIGFIFREASGLCEELRKDFSGRQDLLMKISAAIISRRMVEDHEASDKVQGQFCSGTADVKMLAIPPEKGSEEFKRFCIEDLGIPTESFERGLVKPDFKGVSEFATLLSQQGKPIPKWIKTTVPDYKMRYTIHRKGLLGKVQDPKGGATQADFDATEEATHDETKTEATM